MEWLRDLEIPWLEIGLPVLSFFVGLLLSAWRSQRKRAAAAAVWLQKVKHPHAVSFSLTGVSCQEDDIRLQLLSPGQGTTLSALIGNEVGESRVREAARRCTPVERVIRLSDEAEQRKVLKAVRDTVGAMFAAGSQAWASGVPCRRIDHAVCLTYDDEDPESTEDVSFRVEATPVRLLEWIHEHPDLWRALDPLPGEGHQQSRIEAEVVKAKLWAEQQADGPRLLIRVFSYWPETLFADGDEMERRLSELGERLAYEAGTGLARPSGATEG
jgi:hypothetical protein